jgi:uncharacterized membrane protein
LTISHATPEHISAHAPEVRRINQRDLDWALREGWKDFREKRGDILVLAFLYPLIGFVAVGLAFDGEFAPLLFPIVAGVSLLGPAAAFGFYEIARRREAGMDSGWVHFIDPLRGRARWGLAVLTLALAALFVGWLMAAWIIASATVGVEPNTNVMQFLHGVLTTREGWTLILLGNLVGFGFAVVTLVLSLVSFPMVVDGEGPLVALITSYRAARKNPGVTVAWGLRVAGLLVLGALPAFLGLAIVLPVLGYATWHLYTRLVVR